VGDGRRPVIADPVIILPYLGYGTTKKLTICGRVLEDEGFRPAADADGRWRNLIRFWKRLESDEVPGARVRARGTETVTDREGYFHLELEGSFRAGWNKVPLELLHPARARAMGRVLVPSKKAKFGVISDIDDTVVYSNVTRKLRMILTAAFSNARTRKPFEGVAAFYRALHAGVNPVFYVSKSPWNLFAPIVEYLAVQGLPEGPVLLRDFGLRPEIAQAQDHRSDPEHLPGAEVHPQRRQRGAGSGDLRRHRAAISRTHSGDLHPLSGSETGWENRAPRRGGREDRLPADPRA